ncbi:MAG: hypothetical protein ACKN89_13950 [Cyanobium sp.]|jgi:hypothetical protein|nr:hypothetical protein [Synechococcaceae cyanobacterium]
MDSNLLLAFLAFGAACSSLWAWLIATADEQRRSLEALARPIDPVAPSEAQPPQG